MNRILLLASVSLLTFPLVGIAQSTTQTASLSAPLTAHDAHSLMKGAHSVAEYKELAGYFHQQEAEYRARQLMKRLSWTAGPQVNAGLYQKYPRPVDSARSLYESYLTSANSDALEAQHYDQLAAGEVSMIGNWQHRLRTSSNEAVCDNQGEARRFHCLPPDRMVRAPTLILYSFLIYS